MKSTPIYDSSILKKLLEGNTADKIFKSLERLKQSTKGTHDEMMTRLAEYLSTQEGKDAAYTNNLSK